MLPAPSPSFHVTKTHNPFEGHSTGHTSRCTTHQHRSTGARTGTFAYTIFSYVGILCVHTGAPLPPPTATEPARDLSSSPEQHDILDCTTTPVRRVLGSLQTRNARQLAWTQQCGHRLHSYTPRPENALGRLDLSAAPAPELNGLPPMGPPAAPFRGTPALSLIHI